MKIFKAWIVGLVAQQIDCFIGGALGKEEEVGSCSEELLERGRLAGVVAPDPVGTPEDLVLGDGNEVAARVLIKADDVGRSEALCFESGGCPAVVCTRPYGGEARL